MKERKFVEKYNGRGSYVVIDRLSKIKPDVFYGSVKFANDSKNLWNGAKVQYIHEKDKTFETKIKGKSFDVVPHYAIFLVISIDCTEVKEEYINFKHVTTL